MPQFVDDAIADIATVFHWTPNTFDEMTIVELGQWREKALLKWGGKLKQAVVFAKNLQNSTACYKDFKMEIKTVTFSK
ncbi:GpE family phage tail protein [Mannheimia haemolytica]|nr:GpE family phage tail protein [Mannheimia haemolytica]